MAKTELFVRQQPGGMFAVVREDLTTGDLWFVNSVTGTDAVGYGRNPDAPFATLSYALTKVTANNGDRIYLMATHAETIAAATTLDCAAAGVEIIGLGSGSKRPTITFAGTDSVLGVSAANVSIKNVVLAAGTDEVVKAISITAAFCTLDAVDVIEVAAKQFIQFVLTSALADDLIIRNCRHHQSTAAAANSLWIQLIGADRCKITDNWIFITTTNSASSSVIESDTTAPVNILIARNVIVQLGGASVIPVKLVANSSGYISDNRVASLKTAIAGSIAAASCYCANNYAGHVVNTSGLLEPVVDA